MGNYLGSFFMENVGFCVGGSSIVSELISMWSFFLDGDSFKLPYAEDVAFSSIALPLSLFVSGFSTIQPLSFVLT